MPGWVFKGFEDPYQLGLFAVIYFAFLLPVVRRISAIQHEFTTGIAEHQCVMGLTGAELFLGHFLTNFIIGLVESFLAISIMFVLTNNGHAYAEGMNLGLVITAFVMSQIQYSMFIILITWVFPKGWLALIVAMLILLVCPWQLPEVAMYVPLPKYFSYSKKYKLLASVLPNSALYSLMRIICIARDYEGSASSSLMTRSVLGRDSITIVEHLAVMGICDILMAFLAWYLSKVLPWSTDNRQSPVFCLLPSYWGGENAIDAAEKATVMQDTNRFEELPPGNKAVISIDNLTKVYDNKPALNGVSLTVYESRITVLLGHNGAGKTTMMRILTGMQAPTSGAATVCGYNVSSQREQVRQRVSFCQQTDIFFEDMTCAENLLYFGSLKRGRHRRIKEVIQETLHLVGLKDKAFSMPSQLSGGMKRRLSIAMTLVSDPELLILDEPTAGMDPETRRVVWDTLQNVSKTKTLLLSSHDMEEADAIADQIIMMASGVAVCSGSTAFLKRACGKDIDGVCKPITKRSTMARSFGALFRKRLSSLLRSWGVLIAYFVVPLSLLLFLTWTSSTPTLSHQLGLNKEGTIDIPVNLGAHFPGSTALVGESPATDVSQNLRRLVDSQGGRVISTEDVERELHEVIEKDFASYIRNYAMIVEFKLNATRIMANPTSAVALPIAVNLVDTARLRALTAQPTALINVTIAYLKRGSDDALFDVVVSYLSVWLEWTLHLGLTYSLAFAAYSSFPVAERLSGARDVQLMTGISGAEFIFAHFVFDFLHHALFSFVWCTIHYSFNHYPLSTAGFLLLAFVSSGPLVIGLGYLMAETSVTAGSAAGRIFVIFFVGGPVTIMLKMIIRIWTSSEAVGYVAILFGPYALLSMLVKVRNNANKSAQCKALRQAGPHSMDEASLFVNCDARLLEFTKDGIGLELVTVLVEGLLFLAIATFLTSGYRHSGDSFTPRELLAEEDVEEEKKRVHAARQQEGFAGHSLLAWSLHKRYGNFHAVRGMYMALRPSECFGLLGVNGAGKTTTFQMLAALISASYGDACTAVAKLSGNARKWQSQISYCFQLGGLLDGLNAYEYLYLIGRLRGIPECELKPMVDSIISVVDLDENASKECGVYSGGNRRKLSIGAALLGLQPFVFLDEPYAGVDVVSRNKIFRAVAEIKKRSTTTFVLTSHNMDECEFSCDRLTIMAYGQMMCLGTLQRLREKFGQGYRLEFLLKHTAESDAPRLKQAVAKLFPNALLKDDNRNLLGYHLMERILGASSSPRWGSCRKHSSLNTSWSGRTPSKTSS
ncbi:phospholipid-transporting ATPase ABCA3-like isoform X3 [Dermacentor albipictus]